jgi:hypothetical protein
VVAVSFIDRALNAAADAAKSSAASYQRAQRRRAVEEQVLIHQQTIRWSTGRIGRLALDAAADGLVLPAAAQPAAEAVRRWEAEAAHLRQRLAELDRQLAPPPSIPPPSIPPSSIPPPSIPPPSTPLASIPVTPSEPPPG